MVGTCPEVGRRLAERLGARFRKVRFLALEVAEARAGDTVLFLARPLTFMNVSGPALASFARKRGIPVDRVIACHDEIDLAFKAARRHSGVRALGNDGPVFWFVTDLDAPLKRVVAIDTREPAKGNWPSCGLPFLLTGMSPS